MSMVEFHNVTKNFGESMVLNGISLNIDAVSYTHLTLPTKRKV